MLQWICPECGRECEPVERDCPVCYPQAETQPVPPPVVPKRPKAKAPEPPVFAAPPVTTTAPPPLPPLVTEPREVAAALPVPPPPQIPVLAEMLPVDSLEETALATAPEPPVFAAPPVAAAAPPSLPPLVTEPPVVPVPPPPIQVLAEVLPVDSLEETALAIAPVSPVFVAPPVAAAAPPPMPPLVTEPPVVAAALPVPPPPIPDLLATLPVDSLEETALATAPEPSVFAAPPVAAAAPSPMPPLVTEPPGVAALPVPPPPQIPVLAEVLPVDSLEETALAIAPVSPVFVAPPVAAAAPPPMPPLVTEPPGVAAALPVPTPPIPVLVATLPVDSLRETALATAPVPPAFVSPPVAAAAPPPMPSLVTEPPVVAAALPVPPPPIPDLLATLPVDSLEETALATASEPPVFAAPPVAATAPPLLPPLVTEPQVVLAALPVPTPPIPVLAETLPADSLEETALATAPVPPPIPEIPATVSEEAEELGLLAELTALEPTDLQSHSLPTPPVRPVPPTELPPSLIHSMSQLAMPVAIPPSAPPPIQPAPLSADLAALRGIHPVPPPQPEPVLETNFAGSWGGPAFEPASALACESAEHAPSAVAVLDVLEEPSEFPTAKYPIPNLRPSAVQASEPEPEPDPAFAGWTALSANMKEFDDTNRRVSALTGAELNPIPVQSGTVVLEMVDPVSLDLRSAAVYELRGGCLTPLTLPDVVSPNEASRPLLSETDVQWMPVSEPSKPEPPRGLQELEFDPNLLRYLEAEEERSSELQAMDAVGLAPLSPLVFDASTKPPALPGVHSESVAYVAAPATEVAVIQPDLQPSIDEELHRRVSEFEAEQRAIQQLTAAAAKTAPLLVFADASSRIPVRRPGTPASPVAAQRGFASWPPIGPVGKPVSAFEMEFDNAVLNRVQEWEESCEAEQEQALPAAESQLSSVPVDVPVVEAEFPIVDSAPPPPVAEEPPAVPAVRAEPAQEQALVAYGPVEVEAPEDDVVIHGLTPIIEVPVPPIAKMTRLPNLRLEAVGVKPRLRLTTPQAEFSEFSPLVPTAGKLVKIIPSPIMNIQHSRITAPPGWLVTAAIALLIPITALGVVNYWILPGQRGTTATAPSTAEIPAPVTTAPAAPQTKPAVPAATVGSGANWSKQLEFAGLRLQNSTVKCLVVNHGKDTPLLNLLVTLRSSRGTNDPPVGTFKVRLSPLASGNSREIAEPISFTPPMRSIDWSDLRSDVEVLRP